MRENLDHLLHREALGGVARKLATTARRVRVLEGPARQQTIRRLLRNKGAELAPGDGSVDADRGSPRIGRRAVALLRLCTRSQRDGEERGHELQALRKRRLTLAAQRRQRVRSLLLATVLAASSQLAAGNADIDPPPPAADLDVPTAFVDDFDSGSNHGGWTFAPRGSTVETFLRAEGGNPGWHLGVSRCCDILPPELRTVSNSPFTGDYRARDVRRLEVDVQIVSLEDGPLRKAPLNLLLENHNGTPLDIRDDWGAFFHGGTSHTTPAPGAPWTTLSFAIDSQQRELPPGWELISLDPLQALPVHASWQGLMTSIAAVSFRLGPAHPEFGVDTVLFYDVGADNARIEFLPAAGSVPAAVWALVAIALCRVARPTRLRTAGHT
jgi:hypothetical protein